MMATDPFQGPQGRLGGFGSAGFRIRLTAVADGPRACINALGQGPLVRAAVGLAAPHLGRQVMGVGVEVTLGTEVGGPLLPSLEPAVDQRVRLAQSVALVISQAGIHSFEIGHKHQIDRAWGLTQQEGTGAVPQGLLQASRHGFKGLGRPILLATRESMAAEPFAPAGKKTPLQPPQS